MRRPVLSLLLCAVLASTSLVAGPVGTARAATTSVTLVGSLQSELGCPADWAPACADTHLVPAGHRRHLGGDLRRARRRLRVQGRPQRHLGRRLRRRRGAEGRQHPAEPRRTGPPRVQLRRRHPPDHRPSGNAARRHDARRPPPGHDSLREPAHRGALLLRDGRPVRQRRPVQRPRRPHRLTAGHRVRPDRQRLLPRRRPEGPDRQARLHQEPRHDRDLADAGVQEPAGAGHPGHRERRVPRLLDHRLHPDRPAPRHQRRHEAADQQGPRQGTQGVLRHHHQPHRRRHRLLREDLQLRLHGRQAVPDGLRPGVRPQGRSPARRTSPPSTSTRPSPTTRSSTAQRTRPSRSRPG